MHTSRKDWASTDATLDISIVVPVFNSAATIAELVTRLTSALSRDSARYEIVLVDDGSSDGSWEAIVKQHEVNPLRVVGVQLSRNYGQHNALMCGIRKARGEVVVTMDDDLQNPPEEIKKLVDSLATQNLDLVYGVPRDRQHATWRNIGALLVLAFYRLVFRTDLTPTSYRAMRSSVAQAIGTYDLNYTYIDGLIAWCTDRVGSVEVAHNPRKSGRSGYSVRKLTALALNLFTNFSLLPLQIVTVMGLVAAASGFGVALYYLFRFLYADITVPGFASTIIAILILGGGQMLALGILGEYLGRLHLNVNRKPQYVVRRLITDGDDLGGAAGDSRPNLAATLDVDAGPRAVDRSGSHSVGANSQDGGT